ncbi:MAG: formylglycine-generating enzyme family protein [Cyanobacteria bacterium P01_F01_bin.53]
MPPTLRRTPRTAKGYIEPALSLPSEVLPLHMVLVPGGTFTMGSPADEPQRSDNEGPQREVTVPAFFMGRYPVTQAQWRVGVSFSKVEHDLEVDPARFKGDNHPVETVSWYDAVEFCQRLAQHAKRPYRLPSEAEWEYACRAGTQTPFYFGDTITSNVANYDGNYTYGDAEKGNYRKTTTPVNKFGVANGFGLSDMHGNVWEWCQDHWHQNYEGAPNDGSAWEDREENNTRVLRGGSWDLNPGYCRSACRFNITPDNRFFSFGFRVVCSAPRILQ